MKEEKKGYVLFSGGMDSTYLVQYLIEKGYKELYLIYVNIDNNKSISEAQDIAALQLYAKFKEIYTDIQFNWTVQDIGFHLLNMGVYEAQPFIWAFISSACVPRGSEIFIGYIKDDSAISIINDMNKIAKISDNFKKNGTVKTIINGNGITKIKFPLLTMNKNEIYAKINRNLKKYFSCQMPKIILDNDELKLYTNCGNCNSCLLEKKYFMDFKKYAYSWKNEAIKKNQNRIEVKDTSVLREIIEKISENPLIITTEDLINHKIIVHYCEELLNNTYSIGLKEILIIGKENLLKMIKLNHKLVYNEQKILELFLKNMIVIKEEEPEKEVTSKDDFLNILKSTYEEVKEIKGHIFIKGENNEEFIDTPHD